MSKEENIIYIDNHAHLNFDDFDSDREDVYFRMKENNVGALVVGTKKENSYKAVELGQAQDNLWSIVGLHPVHTEEEVFDKDYYRELAKNNRCIGIGECGFDFYRVGPETKEVQEKAFRAQIELALELDLPLMLHMRSGNGLNAYQESLKVLKEYGACKGEAHFFAGSLEDLKDFLDLGFHISFTGVITFADQYKELIEATPLERLLSETDSPYVAPVPYRGKRCEPVYVMEVIKKMAEIKNISFEQVSKVLLQNSKSLWSWE